MSVCARCGEENSERARFCQACGAALIADEESPEERKLVSVLFVDVVGSTARADRADPEDVRDELRLFYDRVRDQIERFDGTVEKFIGDAVVAVFGAPLAHGDDAERAVRCGLRVIDVIDELNVEFPEMRLAVRAAVCTGEAVVALGTAHERGEALATGDVLNTAARLQAAAPPGRLVVGGDTYGATRRAIRYEPMDPVLAKGKRDPVEAWLAVGPDAAPDRRDPSSSLVGRDRELELLVTIWRRAVEERRPNLVTVLGPPGIGKSRLATEFLRRVEGDGGRILIGRSLPYEEQNAYGASSDQLKTLAGISENEPPTSARRKLSAAVDQVLPDDEEAGEVGRYVSLLLGLGLDEPTDDRLLLFFAVRKLLQGLGSQGPTVVVFEDLHWADEGQLDLLDYLSTHVRDVPLVLMALARPELMDGRPSLGGALLAKTTIPLEPLSGQAVEAIAAEVLGGAAHPAVAQLVAVSGGNPLFVEELAASLTEGAGDVAALPATVREAIASRVDILPAEQRSVLLDASVIGSTFWRGVLRAIDDPGDLDRSLDALEARDLIRRMPRSQVEGDSEFAFKHVLIRDVAYATLPRAVRRERHAAVARHIQTAAGERLRDLAWLLAHHWREAGDRDRAIEYLLLAAERAREAWAKDDVVARFQDAMELADDADRSRTIRLQRGITLVDMGMLAEGAADLDAVLPELEGTDEIEALLARARTTFWLEQVDEAFRFAQEAQDIAERTEGSEYLGPALTYQAAARMITGDVEEAIAFGRRAFEVWVPGTRRADLASLKEFHAENAYWLGDYAEAEELAASAYEMGGELHSAEPLLRGGGWRGLSLIALGRPEEGLTLLDAVIQRSRDLGERRWGAASLNYSSLIFRDSFQTEEARRRNREALEVVQHEGEWGMPQMQGEIDLVFADLLDREFGRVQVTFPSLWDAAINGRSWRPWLGGGRLAVAGAKLARETEGPGAAVEAAHDAIERARRSGRRKYEASARAILGEALVALGRGEEGVAELETALAIADRLGTPTGRWQIGAMLGRARYDTGDDDGASEAYRIAARVIDVFAVTLAPERAAAFLDAEPVREVVKAAG